MSSTWIAIAVVFVVGVLLLGISSAMMRSLREEPAPVRGGRTLWPHAVDESLAHADVPLRLDVVERLAIVDSEWSRGVLERARSEEPDPRVRAAIDTALQRSIVSSPVPDL